MQVTFTAKPFMNYRNDLDECLTYSKSILEYAQFFNTKFWTAQLTFTLKLIASQKGAQVARELW